MCAPSPLPQKEFHQIKNAVIQGAERIRLGEVTFEDDDLNQQDEYEYAGGNSYACQVLAWIIRSKESSLEEKDDAVASLEVQVEKGDSFAQLLVGQPSLNGPLLIPDSLRGKHWLTQAAWAGLPQAQYALGRLLLSDDPEVCDAEDGHTLAEAGRPMYSWPLPVCSKDLSGTIPASVRNRVAGGQQAPGRDDHYGTPTE